MNLKLGWMRCPDCSGHGPYDGEAGDKCKTCDGSGTIKLASCPAAPELETPETNKEHWQAENPNGGPYIGVVRADFARSLERRLSLAQTEIKGLKAERDLHYTRLAGLLFSGALDKYTGGDVQLWAAEYTKKLTEAQSRIAELENKLQRALSSLRSYDSKLADHLAALKGRA